MQFSEQSDNGQRNKFQVVPLEEARGERREIKINPSTPFRGGREDFSKSSISTDLSEIASNFLRFAKDCYNKKIFHVAYEQFKQTFILIARKENKSKEDIKNLVNIAKYIANCLWQQKKYALGVEELKEEMATLNKLPINGEDKVGLLLCAIKFCQEALSNLSEIESGKYAQKKSKKAIVKTAYHFISLLKQAKLDSNQDFKTIEENLPPITGNNINNDNLVKQAKEINEISIKTLRALQKIYISTPKAYLSYLELHSSYNEYSERFNIVEDYQKTKLLLEKYFNLYKNEDEENKVQYRKAHFDIAGRYVLAYVKYFLKEPNYNKAFQATELLDGFDEDLLYLIARKEIYENLRNVFEENKSPWVFVKAYKKLEQIIAKIDSFNSENK